MFKFYANEPFLDPVELLFIAPLISSNFFLAVTAATDLSWLNPSIKASAFLFPIVDSIS